MNRINYYFSSFEKFVQLQLGFRRRILSLYYRIFLPLIKRRIQSKIPSKQLYSLLSIINVPDKLYISENDKQSIIASSNRTCSDIYNILGSGDVILKPIDWHKDFKSGFRWEPGTFYMDYRQEGIESSSDVKVPRELSRCHHMLHCGLAFKITGDEKYSRLIISQIQNWIKENPLMRSINWGCAMDVSIRAINWMYALSLIKNSKEFKNTNIQDITVSLFQHGWFIYRNSEKAPINSHNHYLADLAGQIYLGLLFHSEVPGSRKWLDEGKSELFKEMRYQILPSGMSYERSTNYNRLVLELLLGPIILLNKHHHEIPQDIWYRLEKMFEFIMYSLKPNGISPVVGDQDNGRLFPFGTEKLLDFRYLLSIGAVLFNRSDFKYYSDGYNIYCALLCDENSYIRFNNIPESNSFITSQSFPDAGFYFMRHQNNYLMFNASGKGLYPELNTGTHTHSDLLSFDLVVEGMSLLSDSGSYVYTADAQQRMEFRSTFHHNTVTVDGLSQNILSIESLWNIERNAIPKVISWESNSLLDIIIASHNGYERLEHPITHKRNVEFNKTECKWIVIDELDGIGIHKFDFNFHFDENIDFIIEDNFIKTQNIDLNIKMKFESGSRFKLSKVNTYISKAYGEKILCKKLIVSIQDNAPIRFKTIITKY